MPLFRRKPATAPLSGSRPQSQSQSQQHWVAYVYAPQPVPMPTMYPLQAATPYGRHPAFPVTPSTKYGQLPLQYMPGMPYMYEQSSTTYAASPQHPSNTLPHVRSKVETIYQQQPRRRSYSGSQPLPPVLTAPVSASRGGEADHYYPADPYAVEIQAHSAKQGVITNFLNMVRGRSKSRGRNEVLPSRPRSRGSFVDDGQNRERGRATDPRLRERRISLDKKAKHDSQRSFEKTMMETLEKTAREEHHRSVHRSSTKEELRRKYEAEDRLRQQEEYQRAQTPTPRPSSRNRAASPDSTAVSPMLVEHTKMNARQHFQRPSTDTGYHTDGPTKSSRRPSLHQQMHLASRENSAPALKIPEGFFNRRGDQLMNSKGDILRRPPHLEYPPEFANYPHPGTGWRDHKGQVSYLSNDFPSSKLTHALHNSLSGRTLGGSGRWAKQSPWISCKIRRTLADWSHIESRYAVSSFRFSPPP